MSESALADADRAAAFLRRQLVLLTMTAAVAGASMLSILVVASDVHGMPARLTPVLRGGRLQIEPVVRSATSLEWPIIAALALISALLIVIVRHALQVATFALRKEVH